MQCKSMKRNSAKSNATKTQSQRQTSKLHYAATKSATRGSNPRRLRFEFEYIVRSKEDRTEETSQHNRSKQASLSLSLSPAKTDPSKPGQKNATKNVSRRLHRILPRSIKKPSF
ncbi:hypothetical protein ABZP36_034398 [Zizania latifolia]